MIKVSMNINDKIKVKLTDNGKAVIRKEYEQLRALWPNANITPRYVEDEEGYTTFQLWDFMRIFGPQYWLGCPLYIVHNEIIYVGK